MSLLSPAVNTPLLPILDRLSSSTISPRHINGYYAPTSETPPNMDGQDESPTSGLHCHKGNQKVRKFICKYCARKFLRAEHLRRHEITHTGDKPYHCLYCKEAFSRSDILKRHIAKCRAANESDQIIVEPETPNAPPRRACDRCARLKVRCDFSQPCGRCSRQQMECTYHRLHTNKTNAEERRSSIVSSNGTGHHRRSARNEQKPMSDSSHSFPGFRSSFSLSQPKAVSSPQRALAPNLTSPFLGFFGLQQPSPQENKLNPISPPNPSSHDQNSATRGLSPFTSFQNTASAGPSLMNPSHVAPNHQPFFAQPLDLDPTNADSDVMFVSSDPSDMIFNTQFGAEDTFFTWKPFEYGITDDTSLDFLFGPEVGLLDMGFSPPQVVETSIPHATNANIFDDNAEKSHKDEIPDEGLVATFDPGTGDGVTTDGVVDETVPHTLPLSKSGQFPRLGDYLQLGQVDPLQARCESLAIAIFGSLDNLQQQDPWVVEFFTTDNIKLMLFLWAKRYAQHVPIIHLPTFSILTAPDALLFILCVIGRAYSRPGIDPDRLKWCIDAFNKLSSVARVNGELDMVNLEAVYILVVLCTWHGNKQQRDMARRLYREVVGIARKCGYFHVVQEKKTDGSDEAEWKAWIERETRIRFMMNVYVMDGGYVVFFNARPVLQYHEVQLPFPCDGTLWAAPTAATWKKEMQKPRDRDFLPSTLDALIHASLRPEDDHTDLYGKFILIHGKFEFMLLLMSGLINYIWERQYELDCQTDPFPGDIINFRTSTTRALNNWRRLWDIMLPRLKMDRRQWARLGFFRNSLEYWYAAKLFLAKPRRSGWGQSYDDDNNLFRVKRMLRIVRVWVVAGETKSGLSKRDLTVPNLLETLKVIVPELGSVRIEEAPSVVPSPRPVWKWSKKEDKL